MIGWPTKAYMVIAYGNVNELETVTKPDRLGKFCASQQKRAFSSAVRRLAGNTAQ